MAASNPSHETKVVKPIGEPLSVPIAKAHWRGLETLVEECYPGLHESAPRAEPRLLFHLGAPARVTCRHDNVGHPRLRSCGDLDFLPPWSSVSWDDHDPTSTMSIWMSPSLLATAAQGRARPDKRRLNEPKIGQRDARLFQIALLLKVEAEADDPSDPLFIDSIGVALATRLLDQYGATEPPAIRSKLSKPRLRLTLDYIENHLDGEIRLAKLAELTKLSPSHFRVLFRQTTYRPVHQYVMERRVRRAKTLIESGNVSIIQAALESGFCHQSHLARCMRQVIGLTPSEVARQKEPA